MFVFQQVMNKHKHSFNTERLVLICKNQDVILQKTVSDIL
jgi:hypothetical protein